MRISHAADSIWQLEDNMGVCMTLLAGTERALLIDTGYGMDRLPETVREITTLPLTVVLTHGHHDHALGAVQFGGTCMCAEDLAEFRELTGTAQRLRVAGQAKDKGLTPPVDFLTRKIRDPEKLIFPEKWAGFESRTEELGGMTVRLIHVPGHTPGSICAYVEQRGILLTGDDWNPCTWLWFPSSVGARTWRGAMERLFAGTPFTRVLCSHRPDLFAREVPERFLREMNDGALLKAERTPLGAERGIDTRQVTTEDGQVFVFDYQKFMEEYGV